MKRIIHHANRWFPYVSITVMVFLVAISLYNLLTSVSKNDATIIADDITQLDTIFRKINNEAVILTIDGKKNNINFLTVKKGGFVGSVVGPLNLAYPHKWQGPYVKQNPEVQDVEYQLIKAKEGYYIVPGDGVKLPNGLIMGKDILIDESTDLESLLKNQLQYEGKVLAIKILLPHTVVDKNVAHALSPSEWED